MATEIQNFYKGKTIFITGGTGLVGKAIVEKLLRACNDINRIIVTIRPKKKETSEQRILEYFNDRLFDKIKNNNPNLLKKVLFISTTLEKKNCGFEGQHYDFVTTSTNIIFHCAASVEFNAPLKDAVNCNIIITKNVIDLAKQMTNLQALIHVSTTWSHTIMDFTEEKVHDLSYKPEALCNLVNSTEEKLLSKITPKILGNWPNTYLITKNVSECLIEAEKDHLPVAIFRPAVVTATYREPIPGWLNNSMQAATSVGLGLASGTIQVIHSNPEYNMHFVPADLVVNCVIAVAWHTATQKENHELNVYNYSPIKNIITRKKYYDSFVYTKYPSETIWAPGYIATNSKWWFEKYVLLYHTIPAYIYDVFLKLLNQKPTYEKMQNRTKKLLDSCAYFLLHDFKMEYKNVPDLWKSLNPDDQKIFDFDLDSLNWDEYMEIYTKGAKELLQDDFNNINKYEAKRYLLRCKY